MRIYQASLATCMFMGATAMKSKPVLKFHVIADKHDDVAGFNISQNLTKLAQQKRIEFFMESPSVQWTNNYEPQAYGRQCLPKVNFDYIHRLESFNMSLYVQIVVMQALLEDRNYGIWSTKFKVGMYELNLMINEYNDVHRFQSSHFKEKNELRKLPYEYGYWTQKRLMDWMKQLRKTLWEQTPSLHMLYDQAFYMEQKITKNAFALMLQKCTEKDVEICVGNTTFIRNMQWVNRIQSEFKRNHFKHPGVPIFALMGANHVKDFKLELEESDLCKQYKCIVEPYMIFKQGNPAQIPDEMERYKKTVQETKEQWIQSSWKTAWETDRHQLFWKSWKIKVLQYIANAE